MDPSSKSGPTADKSAQAGAAAYNRLVLSIYDLFVVGFSNSFVWNCPSRLMIDFYNRHVSANHLDVGVGTGYFLDKCQFPAAKPRLALLDLNSNSLQVTSKRLHRFEPASYLANLLEPVELEIPRFDSIGLNYLLHCLPGSMTTKMIVFENLKPLLNQGGVIFGTTILGQGTPFNFMARRLMKVYNARKIFTNTQDNLVGLEQILSNQFDDYTVHVVGCVAFFVAGDGPITAPK